MNPEATLSGDITITCDACGATHVVTLPVTSIDQLTAAMEALCLPLGWEFTPDGDRCPECITAQCQPAGRHDRVTVELSR